MEEMSFHLSSFALQEKAALTPERTVGLKL